MGLIVLNGIVNPSNRHIATDFTGILHVIFYQVVPEHKGLAPCTGLRYIAQLRLNSSFRRGHTIKTYNM